MRLRKIEYEMKQKEIELELHHLEEEGALKLQYKKEALDARDSGSNDGAAPRMKADCLSIGKVQRARTSSAGSTNQISLQTLKTVVLIIQRTVTKTIESVSIGKV